VDFVYYIYTRCFVALLNKLPQPYDNETNNTYNHLNFRLFFDLKTIDIKINLYAVWKITTTKRKYCAKNYIIVLIGHLVILSPWLHLNQSYDIHTFKAFNINNNYSLYYIIYFRHLN